jgi:hypothetical protein
MIKLNRDSNFENCQVKVIIEIEVEGKREKR